MSTLKIGYISKETIKLALECIKRQYDWDKEESINGDYPRAPTFSEDAPAYKKAIKELENYQWQAFMSNPFVYERPEPDTDRPTER